MKFTFLISIILIATSVTAIAAPKKAKQKKPEKNTDIRTVEPETPPSSFDDNTVAKSSTRIDFSETAIDGQMKAPEGFFLQGHSANSMSQLVKLRSNFRSELRNSRSAVKSHVR